MFAFVTYAIYRIIIRVLTVQIQAKPKTHKKLFSTLIAHGFWWSYSEMAMSMSCLETVMIVSCLEIAMIMSCLEIAMIMSRLEIAMFMSGLEIAMIMSHLEIGMSMSC